MSMFKLNVYLENKFIDAVFYHMHQTETIKAFCERVKESLVSHDDYNPSIKVVWPKGQRITETYYELQGNYGQGWECLCSETSYKEARQRRKEYRENEGGNHRIVTKRERKTG